MAIWPLTSYSDFPTNQTFHQFHDLDTELVLHRITSGFNGAFSTGVACQQGTLILTDTGLVSPLLGGGGGLVYMLWLLRPVYRTLHWFNDRTELDLKRIKRGFHGAFAMGVACQQGALTLKDTWFCPPFGDVLMLQLLRPVFPWLFTLNTPRYFLDFALFVVAEGWLLLDIGWFVLFIEEQEQEWQQSYRSMSFVQRIQE